MIASKPVRLLSLAIVALVVVAGVCAIVGGFAFDGDPLDSPARADNRRKHTGGEVTYVLDGDTVQVTTQDGRDVRVLFLGISAPEVPQPDEPGQCYGHASTRHLDQLLPAGTRVTLVSDLTQDDVDHYDRWLRYVLVSGRDIGAAQIRAGAAATRNSSKPVSRHAAYVQLEAKSRDRGAGMWMTCS